MGRDSPTRSMFVVVIVVTAGCAGAVTDTAEPDDTPEPTEFRPANGLDDRLSVNTLSTSELRIVVLLPRADNRTVAERTYPPEAGPIDVPKTNETTAVYAVRLYVSDRLNWQQELSPAVKYDLVVRENGTVEVTGYAEQ